MDKQAPKTWINASACVIILQLVALLSANSVRADEQIHEWWIIGTKWSCRMCILKLFCWPQQNLTEEGKRSSIHKHLTSWFINELQLNTVEMFDTLSSLKAHELVLESIFFDHSSIRPTYWIIQKIIWFIGIFCFSNLLAMPISKFVSSFIFYKFQFPIPII